MAGFIRPYMEVMPAYGREYATEDVCHKDWQDGKDFQDCMTGQYLSIRDLAACRVDMQMEDIGFRFNGNLQYIIDIRNKS